MIVAFMKPAEGGKKNGRMIPITMTSPASARFHHDGSRLAPAPCHPRSRARSSVRHPASLVSSPSSPRGRRIIIAIR